jgi:hypothetical protein
MKSQSSVLLALVLALSGCSSDPFENAGACKTPGKYERFEARLAVCVGLEGKYKFYFEGPHFDAMYLLGKSEYDTLNFDNEDAFLDLAEKRGYKDLTWRTDWVISNDEIAGFANGDSRWDSLIEANSKFTALKYEFDSAQKYRFQLLNDYRNGKVSRAAAYAAQEDALKIAKKRDLAMEVFSAKLAVLRSELRGLYKISDPLESMMFVIARQYNL